MQSKGCAAGSLWRMEMAGGSGRIVPLLAPLLSFMRWQLAHAQWLPRSEWGQMLGFFQESNSYATFNCHVACPQGGTYLVQPGISGTYACLPHRPHYSTLIPRFAPPVSMPHVMHSKSYPSAITPPPMIPSIMITVMVGVVGGVVVWRTEMMAEGTPCPSLPRFCTMAAGASGVARIENS